MLKIPRVHGGNQERKLNELALARLDERGLFISERRMLTPTDSS